MASSKVVANSVCALFGHTIVPECAVDIQVPQNHKLHRESALLQIPNKE